MKALPPWNQRLGIRIRYRRGNLLLIILLLLRFLQSQICCFDWHSLCVFAYKYSCTWYFLTFPLFLIRKSNNMSFMEVQCFLMMALRYYILPLKIINTIDIFAIVCLVLYALKKCRTYLVHSSQTLHVYVC